MLSPAAAAPAVPSSYRDSSIRRGSVVIPPRAARRPSIRQSVAGLSDQAGMFAGWGPQGSGAPSESGLMDSAHGSQVGTPPSFQVGAAHLQRSGTIYHDPSGGSYGEDTPGGLGPSPGDVKISSEVARAMALALAEGGEGPETRAGTGFGWDGTGREQAAAGGVDDQGEDVWATPRVGAVPAGEGLAAPGEHGLEYGRGPDSGPLGPMREGSGQESGLGSPFMLPEGAHRGDEEDEEGALMQEGPSTGSTAFHRAMVWRVPSDTEHLTRGYSH